MQFDKQTRNLRRSYVRLRKGLCFAPQQHRGEVYYHIEDTLASGFYRVGYPQYLFISLLDGTTSFSSALALAAQQLGAEALTEQEATQLVHWLLQNNLANFADEMVKADKPEQRNAWTAWQKLNPFWLKIPLGSPDRFFEILLPYFRWAFSPLFAVAVGFLYFSAICTIARLHERFADASISIFAPTNWVWMLATWVFLKFLHECAHGLSCKYFGGTIKETGLVFILFAPMAYVDVTSTWRLPSKWQRILVASAGMIVELAIAAVAVLLWSRADSQLTAQVLFNVILMAGASTVLFNANPLMRFDGYFILSDFLEIPNLYEKGVQQTQNFTRWLFLGVNNRPFESNDSLGTQIFLRIYGFAAACWKVVICGSLLVGASTMFHGAGVLLGIMGVVLWFAPAAWKAMRGLHFRYFESRPAFVRAVSVTWLLAFAAWSLWAFVPTPARLTVPCIVDYDQAAFVRANSNGFVDQVLVKEGQLVTAGTELLQLRNDELVVEIARLNSEWSQSAQRARIARDEMKPAMVQVELERQRSIQQELDDKQEQLDSLTVVSPRDGHIVAKDLAALVGTYVRKGNELLAVGHDESKELLISISQDHVKDVLPQIGETVSIRIGSRSKVRGTLERVEPRASAVPNHEAFAATSGGPIPVKPTESTDQRTNAVEFHEPRFAGVITIDKSDAVDLHSGESGTVQLGGRSLTLGRWAYLAVKRFVDRRVNAYANS